MSTKKLQLIGDFGTKICAQGEEPTDTKVIWIDTDDNEGNSDQVVVDDTLTQSGWAADAKTTGDAIKSKADLEYVRNLENNKIPDVDNTLSEVGAAAEAKATGDAINQLAAQLNGLIHIGNTAPTNILDGMIWVDTSESQIIDNEVS